MAKSSQQPASFPHQAGDLKLSWDDLKILVACSQATSFRRASQALGLSSSTVVRRIEKLERVMGVRLFERLPEGVILTREGRAISAGAQGMERALFDVIRGRNQVARERSSVSISVTEGLGAYWIMPQLAAFQRSNPDLLIHMRCAMTNADVLRLEADLAIQFNKPSNPDLIVSKLGCLNVYPYASAEYLRTFGTPRSRDEMLHHRLVNQTAPQLDGGAWGRYLDMENVNKIVGIDANTSTAVLFAVEAGAGIGALPTYVGALNPTIIPVDIGVRHQIEIWLTYHPDLRRNPRRAIVIDWIKSIFDPKTHPYFSDEFIVPPDERLKAPFRHRIVAPHMLLP